MAYGCIYSITHIASGRYYIGQTKAARPNDRWCSHKWSARHNAHCIIDRAMAKRGPEEFVFEVLAYADSKEQLNQLEKLWIVVTSSRTTKIGYNARHGGDGGGVISEESRKKMSEAAKRRIQANPEAWAERNRRITHLPRGKYSEQAKRNLSAGQMRRHLANPEFVKDIIKKGAIKTRNWWASATPQEKVLRLAPMKKARWRNHGD